MNIGGETLQSVNKVDHVTAEEELNAALEVVEPLALFGGMSRVHDRGDLVNVAKLTVLDPFQTVQKRVIVAVHIRHLKDEILFLRCAKELFEGLYVSTRGLIHVHMHAVVCPKLRFVYKVALIGFHQNRFHTLLEQGVAVGKENIVIRRIF